MIENNMKNAVKFSIIIPVAEINDYIRSFTPRILNQTYKNFEIIIIPNEMPKNTFKLAKSRIVASGKVGPAVKRDLGAKIARGNVLAFIDDDAYPDDRWLERAAKYFEKKDIAGVGGPQLTPKESNDFQTLSGMVLSSWLVSGDQSHRYHVGRKPIEYYDMPSCNLFIRKSAFLEIGGFDTSFWPGEDTKLCLDIKKSGKKMVYDPGIIVYHHRRKDFKGYIKQIFTYSSHRGYFMKKYPETSLKFSYLVPSLFLLGIIIGGILSLFSSFIRTTYLSVLGFYLILLIIEGFRTGKFKIVPKFIGLSFITHMIYGVGVIRGIFKKNLMSKYR